MNNFFKNRTILILDNDRKDILIIKNIIGSDYNIKESNNILEMQDNKNVSLIIIGSKNKLDKFDTLEIIKGDEYLNLVPTFMIIKNNDTESKIRALNKGINGIITKPFNKKIISKQIMNIIENREIKIIDERNKAYESELNKIDIDEKSGIFNKDAFCRYANSMMIKHKVKKFVLIRLNIFSCNAYNENLCATDIDNNDKEIGNFLIEYSQRNTSINTYARYDSNSFVCCCEISEFDIEKFINDIDSNLELKFFEFDYKYKIGLCLVDDNTNIELICERALIAINYIEENYNKRYIWFDNYMIDEIVEQNDILNEMEFALESGQFTAYLQPQYNYETGKMIGAEALVRWEHPIKGTIFPDKFVKLFETNGFISKLDAYIMEQSCKLLRKWEDDKGMCIVPISVNVSRRDTENPNFVKDINDLINKYNLKSNLLNIEITESYYAQDDDNIINIVNELRKNGFEVHMDDFGSGYSSLNMLKNINVDVIKLDSKFIYGDFKNERCINILKSIMDIASALKIKVIAEGIENKDQAELLNSLGCKLMQGYFFSKPVKIETFENLLKH